MNTFLKACVDEAFDLVAAGADAIGKQYAAAVTNVIKAVQDAPALIAADSDAKAELQALISDPASDADLLAYVGTKLGTEPAQAGAAAIVLAAADLGLNGVLPCVQKGIALANAIKAAKAPAASA